MVESEKKYLVIDIEDEIHMNIDPESEFTSEEMNEIIDRAKYYIDSDESFWNSFNSCVSDAISYVKNKKEK